MLTNSIVNPISTPYIAEYRNLRRPASFSPKTKSNKAPIIGGTITWNVSATVHDGEDRTVTVELLTVGSKKAVKTLETRLEEKDRLLKEKIISEKKLQLALKQSEESRIFAENRLREAWKLLHIKQEKQIQKQSDSKKRASSFPVLLQLLKDPTNREKVNSTFQQLKKEQGDNFHQLLGHNPNLSFPTEKVGAISSSNILEKNVVPSPSNGFFVTE